jgi:CHAT domain-containing protein/Flp pilus assembly protein TadD
MKDVGVLIQKGNDAFERGEYEEAIASYEEALKSNPSLHKEQEASTNCGRAEGRLEKHVRAIASFDKALALNPDSLKALNGRCAALIGLGKNIEALPCLEKILELNPDDPKALCNKGIAWLHLGHYQKAIEALDKALKIEPDCSISQHGMGSALLSLGNYDNAIEYFKKALMLTRNHEKALTFTQNHKKALIRTQNKFWKMWESLVFATYYQDCHAPNQGWQDVLTTWKDVIQTLKPTHKEYELGLGYLYSCKGSIQYIEGRKGINPFLYWSKAKDNYHQALKYLSIDKFPIEHLTTLQKLYTVPNQSDSPQKSLALLQEASDLLERVLQNPIFTAGEKISLRRKFAGFNQLQVKSLAQEQPIQALEHAEVHKNLCLGHLRNGWNCQSSGPLYAQIQNLISPRTAAIYWHLSPAALTTFIIRYGQFPEVLRPKPTPVDPNVPLSQSYPPAAYQLSKLEDWIQKWKQNYRSYRDLDPKTEDLKAASWRKLMEGDEPFTQLPTILEINRLCEEYLDGIDQLILIPHRDLHLLPLHALFPERFTISYLPSAQMGLELHHRDSLVGDRILCIEDPTVTLSSAENKKNLAPLTFAKREVEAILHFYKATNNSLISGKSATKSTITESFNAIHDCLHFTGHGFHNIEEPLQSALALAGDDRLTLEDIFQLNLQDYSLVCLSACETGITSSQNIIDEYVGLVSGFLAAGAAHVISTLWTVEDESSSLLMAQFHNYLRQSLSPTQALSEAQRWLKTLTYQRLGKWYKTLANELDTIDPGCNQAENFESLAREAYRKFEAEVIEPLYAHPYHWAGFIITGKVPEG